MPCGGRLMIKYSLKCDQGHGFESWFKSGEAFGKLMDAGMLHCEICGSGTVEKQLMAPAVRSEKGAMEPVVAAPERPLSAPSNPAEAAMKALREKVEANSEYVGLSFAKEARAMHAGEAPERSIYGEAKLDEARKLLEDGVPVTPLPFAPKRKSN